ncbi:hypothetical protein ACFL4A_01535 [bacterium]
MKILTVLLISLLLFNSGCFILNIKNSVVGTPVHHLDSSENVQVRFFDAGYSGDVFDRVLEWLKKQNEVSVYKKKYPNKIYARGFGSIYLHCIDTTEVGFYFENISDGKLQVKITSLNYELAEFLMEEKITPLINNFNPSEN